MYQPSNEVLEKYAEVLINFALNGGEGLRKGEVVHLEIQLPALELGKQVYKKILQAGGNVITRISAEEFQKILYEVAADEQLEFFPQNYHKSLVDTIDHRVALRGETDPELLKDVEPRKIMLSNKFRKDYRRWLDEKEDAGKLTWTLANYPTEGTAVQAGLTLEEYWQQVIKACFLDEVDPVAKWREVFSGIEDVRTKLNALPIEKLHVTAKETDLWITLGEGRKWIGGSGKNIPSFEIFTSPDWRGTNGTIFFDLPLFRYGNIIKDIRIEFKDGKVVNATASQNQELLLEMIKQENADKIGEFSLTDHRFSHIDTFMADTLYDENFGGTFGNTHLALGTSYHDTYTGDMHAADWEALGFNESVEHCDIIATSDRKVEAVLKDGSAVVIYEGGEFRV